MSKKKRNTEELLQIDKEHLKITCSYIIPNGDRLSAFPLRSEQAQDVHAPSSHSNSPGSSWESNKARRRK